MVYSNRSSSTSPVPLLLCAFVCTALVHLALSSLSRQPHHPAAPAAAAPHSLFNRLVKRGIHEQHQDETPAPDALIDYWALWESSTTPASKVLTFSLFVLWLLFLFAFVGITASDFFCLNLSTLASRLGMSESLAGVTFLAFSNGSPDVFSTFSALRANAGALAIGELLGAASFITSVVVGSMCLIQPFRVARHSFLRDVGFFTLAIFLTLACLYDGHITLVESLCMVALYVAYVILVAVGSWWIARRDRQRERLRKARSAYDDTAADEDEQAVENGHHRGATDEQDDTFLYHDSDEEDDNSDDYALSPSAPSPIHNASPIDNSTDAQNGYPFPARAPPPLPATAAGQRLGRAPHSASSSSMRHVHTHERLVDDTFVSMSERGAGPATLMRTRSRAASAAPALGEPPATAAAGTSSPGRRGSGHASPDRLDVSAPSSSARARDDDLTLATSGIAPLGGGSSSPAASPLASPGAASGTRRPANVHRASVRPSLLGAIEFRDVVNSLRADSGARTLAVFGHAGGRRHTHAVYVGAEPNAQQRRAAAAQAQAQLERHRQHHHHHRARSGTDADLRTTSSEAHSARPRRSKSHTGIHLRRERDRQALVDEGSLSDTPAQQAPHRAPSPVESLLSSTEGLHHPGLISARRAISTLTGTGVRYPSSTTHSDDEGDLAAEGGGPLIDLSAGVENPWQQVVSARSGREVPAPQPHEVHDDHHLDSPVPQWQRHQPKSSVPSIMLTDEQGDTTTAAAPPPPATPPAAAAAAPAQRKRWSILPRVRAVYVAHAVVWALFPSLQGFRDKSLLGKTSAIFCVPALLLLNLTLPVVEDVADEEACLEIEEHEAQDDDAYHDDEAGAASGDDSCSLCSSEEEEGGEDGARKSSNKGRRTRRRARLDEHETAAARHAIAQALHKQAVPPPPLPEADYSPWREEGHEPAAPLDLDGVDRELREAQEQQERRGGPLAQEPTMPTQDGELSLGGGRRTGGKGLTTPPSTPFDAPVTDDTLLRALNATQCTLAPVFCAIAITGAVFLCQDALETAVADGTGCEQRTTCSGGSRASRCSSASLLAHSPLSRSAREDTGAGSFSASWACS